MSDVVLEQAQQNANAVIALLTRSQVPPEPLFYKLFYNYLVGVPDQDADPQGATLRRALRSGGPIGDRLYAEFVRPYREANDVDHRAGVRMAERLAVLVDLLGTADAATKTHSHSLADAATYFSRDDVQVTLLLELVGRLEVTNQRVVEANRALSREIEETQSEFGFVAAEIEALKDAARFDALTGLMNRGDFDDALLAAIGTATARTQPLAVAMIDIDHFKRLNDTYGHPLGDEVLRGMGRALLSIARPGDIMGRFGGDEFVAVLPNTDVAEALSLAERMREAALDFDMKAFLGEEVFGSVTASIGVAALMPGDDAAAVLTRADCYLFDAKRAGRNRVMSELAEIEPA